MNSQAGWYWIAVGVFALGLSTNLANRDFGWLDCATERAANIVQRVADRIADRVQLAADRFSDRSADLEVRSELAVAHAQAQLACLRAEKVRRQAAVVQMKANKVRLMNLQNRFPVAVECPEAKVKVEIQKISTDRDSI